MQHIKTEPFAAFMLSRAMASLCHPQHLHLPEDVRQVMPCIWLGRHVRNSRARLVLLCQHRR